MAEAPKRMSLPVRIVFQLLARQRGEVKALSDLMQLRGRIRFAIVFALTIIAPGLTLAYFGWTSIRAEELSVQVDVTRRAESVSDGANIRVDDLFTSFESAVRSRLESGRSPVESLRELSPYLRVAFRLDGDGNLAAPFFPPGATPTLDQTIYLSSPWRDAILAEQSGADPVRAAELYAQAAEQGRSEAIRGQAVFARGRALMKGGQLEHAKTVFADVVADYGEQRSIHGFRLGDLAQLKRGEILLDKEPVIGTGSLQALVEDLLDSRWTIGLGGEAAIVARSLEILEDFAPKDWLASARRRLEEKGSQLFWAEMLSDDLEILTAGGNAMRVSPGEFNYHRVGNTLWASTWWGNDFYAFALDFKGLLSGIFEVARNVGATDAVLVLQVVAPDTQVPEGTMSRRSLAPWLPGWSIVSTAADPDGLRALQTRKRTQRIAVILLSVFMIATGAVLSVWLVSRELDLARVKADFAANVSHELRSPITQIRLKGESLMLGLVFDEEGKTEHYEAIVRESERLSRLVDNVLDFSAIERGAKKYMFRPVDLGETVRSATDAARFSMEARQMEFDLALPSDLPVVFHDPEAVGQVVHNLISNAAKYGKEGGWIGVSGEFAAAGVKIHVADRGIGIPPQDLPRIFEEYYRSSDPEARRRKGTGIGLTIVKYIMEAHGGRVTVTSNVGSGTVFTLHFPLRPPETLGA